MYIVLPYQYYHTCDWWCDEESSLVVDECEEIYHLYPA